MRKVLRTLAILAAAIRAAAILVEVILAEGIPVGVTPGAAIQEGGGYPGGGYPGGRPGGPGYGGQDIENNPKIQPLLRPAGLLNVDLKDQEIDVTEDQYRKLLLYTDGRLVPKQTDNNREEIAAHWDGNHLVSDEKSPLGGKMSRVYELSEDGRQLYETLHIDNGRSGTPITIKYVYDIPTSDADAHIQNPEDSDPGRPTLKRRTQRRRKYSPATVRKVFSVRAGCRRLARLYFLPKMRFRLSP